MTVASPKFEVQAPIRENFEFISDDEISVTSPFDSPVPVPSAVDVTKVKNISQAERFEKLQQQVREIIGKHEICLEFSAVSSTSASSSGAPEIEQSVSKPIFQPTTRQVLKGGMREVTAKPPRASSAPKNLVNTNLVNLAPESSFSSDAFAVDRSDSLIHELAIAAANVEQEDSMDCCSSCSADTPKSVSLTTMLVDLYVFSNLQNQN